MSSQRYSEDTIGKMATTGGSLVNKLMLGSRLSEADANYVGTRAEAAVREALKERVGGHLGDSTEACAARDATWTPGVR